MKVLAVETVDQDYLPIHMLDGKRRHTYNEEF